MNEIYGFSAQKNASHLIDLKQLQFFEEFQIS